MLLSAPRIRCICGRCFVLIAVPGMKISVSFSRTPCGAVAELVEVNGDKAAIYMRGCESVHFDEASPIGPTVWEILVDEDQLFSDDGRVDPSSGST